MGASRRGCLEDLTRKTYPHLDKGIRKFTKRPLSINKSVCRFLGTGRGGHDFTSSLFSYERVKNLQIESTSDALKQILLEIKQWIATLVLMKYRHSVILTVPEI